MEDEFAPRPVAGWYMIAAVASFLFMAIGCAALVMHIMTNPATLPLDQRALMEAEPTWVVSASTFGFVTGLVGSILLLLRRIEAERAFLFSLIGMIIWFVGMFATPAFRDLLSTNEIAILLAVVAVTWTIFWFARHSRQRGWLHR